MREVRQARHSAPPANSDAGAAHGARAGRVIGGCRLVRPLSAGGMGEVFLGQQLRLGDRPVAVKLVRPQVVAGDPSEAQAVEQRFLSEGAVLGALAHPNILPVHDSGLDGGYLYLVMQYAPDGSLADAIKGRGPLRLRLPASIPLAADLIGQVAAALQYTHDHDIVHRDVKPGNILLQVYPDGHWHIMLADFGIAHGVENTANTQQVTGTVAYMAPEQLTGRFSPASDQYALGVLAFLLLSGRTPFLGGVAEQANGHLYQTPPPLRTLNSAIPLELAEVVSRALHKNPADRWPTVTTFAQAFARAAALASPDTVRTVTPRAGLPPLPFIAPTGEASRAATGNATTRAASDSASTQLASPTPALPAHEPSTAPEAARALHGTRPLPTTGAASGTPEFAGRGLPNASEATPPHARPPVAVAPPPPGAPPRRHSKKRRRFAIFAATVALLLLTSVAAIALKDRGILRGAQQPRYTATAGEGPTYTPAEPTLAPTISPSAASTPTTTQPATAPDQAAARTISAPRTSYPGQIETINLSFTNTGTSTWSAANGYTLACDAVRHSDAACRGLPVIGLGSNTVSPGQSLTVALNIKAPAAPGTYRTYWNLAHSGRFFSSPDAAVTLKVVPAHRPTATPRPRSTNTPAPAPTNSPVAAPTDTPTPAPAATTAPASPPPTATTATSPSPIGPAATSGPAATATA